MIRPEWMIRRQNQVVQYGVSRPHPIIHHGVILPIGQIIRDLFKRPPDLVPNDVEACWQLTDTGWLYILQDPEHAGTSFNTVLVDDVEPFAAEQERKGGMRAAWVTDPDGNRLQFAAPA